MAEVTCSSLWRLNHKGGGGVANSLYLLTAYADAVSMPCNLLGLRSLFYLSVRHARENMKHMVSSKRHHGRRYKSVGRLIVIDNICRLQWRHFSDTLRKATIRDCYSGGTIIKIV